MTQVEKARGSRLSEETGSSKQNVVANGLIAQRDNVRSKDDFGVAMDAAGKVEETLNNVARDSDWLRHGDLCVVWIRFG